MIYLKIYTILDHAVQETHESYGKQNFKFSGMYQKEKLGLVLSQIFPTDLTTFLSLKLANAYTHVFKKNISDRNPATLPETYQRNYYFFLAGKIIKSNHRSIDTSK